MAYGIPTNEGGKNNLKYQHEYRRYIEPVSYAVFLEHHILMQKRIDYLISKGMVNDGIGIEHNKIVDRSQYIYSACLQYNTSFNPEQIKQIYNGVSVIIENEQQILNRLLEALRSCR